MPQTPLFWEESPGKAAAPLRGQRVKGWLNPWILPQAEKPFEGLLPALPGMGQAEGTGPGHLLLPFRASSWQWTRLLPHGPDQKSSPRVPGMHQGAGMIH